VANAYIESRIAITRAIIVLMAVLIAALFTWGAVAVPEPGWFVALPVNGVAVALVVIGSRRRVVTQGESGGGVMSLGGLLVAASVVVAFALGNAT
jgi:hypothetical protein